MNTENKSFTGRRRERKTKPGVHVANKIAKYIITLGGIGTIVSVLLVAFFLVYVVIPLFLPPSLPFEEDYSFSELFGGASLLDLKVDDYLEYGYMILDDGTLVTINLVDGSIIKRQDLFGSEDQQVPDQQTTTQPDTVNPGSEDSIEIEARPRITSIARAVNADDLIFCFDNGTVRLGKITFKIAYLDDEDVSKELKGLEPDQPQAYRNGMVRRTAQNQLRYQELDIDIAEPLVVSEDGVPVLEADFSNTGFGEAFVTLLANGKLSYSKINRRTNMLTGKDTITTTSSELTIESPYPGVQPKWVKLSGLGEFVYVIWEEGIVQRYNSRDINNMSLMEEVNVNDEPNEKITAVDFLIGKRSLIFGHSTGDVNVWFPTRQEGAATEDGSSLTKAHVLEGAENAAATALAYSERSRKMAAGFADGSVRIYYATNDSLLASGQLVESNDPILGIVISPKEDHLVAVSSNNISLWEIDAPYPETTLEAMFLPVWYEGFSEPAHAWQTSSAGSDFEPKYGMWPLIFGTLKATFYSLLFGVPIALLAAIYTSEFLHPKYKTAFKPTIEMMASLPSVVLGFMAGLVIAPYVEDAVPHVLVGMFVIPLTIILGGYLWQLIPPGMMVRAQRYRLWGILLAIPLGVWFSALLGGPVEDWLFSGNIKAWLADHSIGSAVGGWMLLLVPVSALMVVVLSSMLAPQVRKFTAGWNSTKYAGFDIIKFLAALALTLIIALLLSNILSGLGLDARGNYIDTYVQRNAMIVGFIMGFAIIPIIYTIAEDALSAVPEHLRAGSLGAGATPWQTAVRIIIPTAMSGLFSAIMIGLGRAVGETMIVLMAAGNTPVLEMNIFNGFRTLSANIAVELPEAVRNSTHYRSLFLAALVLFIMTFIINTLAEVVRQRFRKRSSQL